MPDGELDRSGPALAEVAAEMSEIFDRAGLGRSRRGLRPLAAFLAWRPSLGGGRTAILLTAAAAGLLGFGAGAIVMHPPGPPVARVAAAAQPQFPVEPQLSAKPQPEPQSQPQSEGPASPQVAVAQAVPPPLPEARPKATAKAKASVHSAAAGSRTQFRTKLAKLDEGEVEPPIRLREPAAVAQPASCAKDANSEDCRHAVIQADRHLRAVYQRAFERGVSRKVLVDYRDRWADLRERNDEDPVRLIESYGALAYDLGRETADDQAAAQRPKSRSGLGALADLLLPWR